ncbi:alpha/beta fold hydrolase [Euzebya sp.]|uniref:alpha/beta fold hydrolase n=1 Tax=Euzebya sp. TaxID=1971409 RepID=UPI003518C727
MAHITAGGMRIAVREEGEGRPVVLIHGNSASSGTWARQFDSPLVDRARLIALDLPGHGASDRAADPADYSMPGYAAVVAQVLDALDATGAVLVGWSLGGHIALEAVPLRDDLAAVAIFGTPPVGKPPAMDQAFLPNPAMDVGFTADVDTAGAEAYAASFLAPGSTLGTEPFTADILATHGGARSGLMASIGEGRFADELEVVAGMRIPLAVLHGEGEQLVSLDYLRGVEAPTLWRGEVQVIPGAGHAPHAEAPEAFNGLLGDLLDEL